MGEFSMTCSISGLGISGGTPVRCLLLAASPYGAHEDPRNAWIVRTPPLRAIYNSYGTIEKIHTDDEFIADLWLRGLREDLIEKGLGDNSYHDVPTAKDMSIDELLDAVRAGRVEVRQDAKHFWRRPRTRDPLGIYAAHEAKTALVPSLRKIEGVLAKDMALLMFYPDPVSSGAVEDKFVIDEPVPHLVRVRFGRYQHGDKVIAALTAARAAVERAGFIGAVIAGSGRYAGDADLLVMPAPNAKDHIRGPQWDMAAGRDADEDKHLMIAMAMVREDVWQAIVRYPHSESVSLLCTSCGQESWYHAKDRSCPDKSVNGKPFKEHPTDARYAHGPVFPADVPHVVIPRDYGETVWYDVAAFKDGARATWQTILDHFKNDLHALRSIVKDAREHEEHASQDETAKVTVEEIVAKEADPQIEAILRHLEEAREKEAARVAQLPADEREKLEAERKAAREAWEAEERERKEHPCFGDFLISDMIVNDSRRPGAWLFRDSVPGVIGIPAHLSMCLADKREVPLAVIDAIAELSAVNHAIHGVGVTWKPAVSTGPQYPEWDQHLRFTRTLAQIAHTAEAKRRVDMDDDDEDEAIYATLGDVPQAGILTPATGPTGPIGSTGLTTAYVRAIGPTGPTGFTGPTAAFNEIPVRSESPRVEAPPPHILILGMGLLMCFMLILIGLLLL